MPVESVKSFFDWATVVLIALTVITGAGALITGAKINKAQTVEQKKLETSVEEAHGKVATLQKEAADAKAAQQGVELALEAQKALTAQAQERVLELAKRQAGRAIEKGALSSLLKGRAGGTVKIWYQPDDTEAYQYAISIFGEFTGTGWTANSIERIPDGASLATSLPIEARDSMTTQLHAAERQLLPISVRGGGGAGLALIAPSILPDQPKHGAYQVLYHALLAVNKQLASRPNPDLPKDTFIIVVGPKQ